SIFRAPLGGALLVAEVLYRKDADPAVAAKALPAALVGYGVFGLFFGYGPILGRHGAAPIGGGAGLVAVAVIGVLCGLTGRAYAAAFYRVLRRADAAARTTTRRLALPALGGLVVGTLGLLVPGVLGTGYGLMQALMDRDVLLGMSLWTVLLLAPAKLAGTALSIGSGGSGGLFGPGLVMGAGVGALVWRVADGLGAAPYQPTAFIVVGMAACLGPVVRAPLAVLVMAAETVGDATLLVPTALGVLCASWVMGDVTIYRSQPDHRGDVTPGR
ncbi:MAG: chloride channel protein, partial [Streptomycetaceae bacterium]|nr:chloride channel protein [Streptomycetaceae bacterium]